MTYMNIVSNLENNPRDIHTVPIRKKEPLWFYAYAENGIIYIEPGREHNPCSTITKRRRLNPQEFEPMLDIYHRRCNGEEVAKEGRETSQCQAYWYGVFAEFKL